MNSNHHNSTMWSTFCVKSGQQFKFRVSVASFYIAHINLLLLVRYPGCIIITMYIATTEPSNHVYHDHSRLLSMLTYDDITDDI